jgi:hypothetical protein
VISLLIYLLIVGIVIGLVFYVVDAIPVPAPLGKMIKIVAIVLGCLVLIFLLLQLAGVPVPLTLRP